MIKFSVLQKPKILFVGIFKALLPFYSFFLYLCINLKIITTANLHINELKYYFKDKIVFETKNIFDFYEQTEKDVKPTTVNWWIYTLVQLGVLQRIGRGKFTFGKSKNYVPEISSTIKTTFKKLKTEFPFANLCIWNTSSLNEFMLHQPNQFFTLVETDKETTDAVFYFLREIKKSVFIEPTKDILEKYAANKNEVFIVKPLVSEAPTQNINNVKTTSIEKMLVDIFCDDIIFAAQQGVEMRTIFSEAFRKYTINQSKMLRYANRRRKKEELKNFVNTITNLWQ